MIRNSRSLLRVLFSPYSEEHSSGQNPSPSFQWTDFAKHYLHALTWILVLMLLGHVLEVSGVLKGLETAGLDTFLRLNSRKMSDRVVIVEITDEDYDNPALFDGKSPLKSNQLIALIASLQPYEPAVIAMDFDTESGDWCKISSADLQKVLPQQEDSRDAPHVPVVWAEVPQNLEEPLELTPVLGGQLQNLAYVGVPRFPVDSDGLVRRYEEKFLVTGGLGDCSQEPRTSHHIPQGTQQLTAPANRDRLPSFANAIRRHACESRKLVCQSEGEDSDGPVIFNFYGDRYRFPIIQSHEFIGPEAQARAADPDLRKARGQLLHNRIVLIGGNYSAARDVYATPLGPMAGVELIALALESDFSGGIRDTKVAELLADFIFGSLVVFAYFYYRRRPNVAFRISLFGVPLLAVLTSLILFRTAAYWLNFMPIVIGMMMHQMLELSESCEELQAELHHHRLENEQLSARLRLTATEAQPEVPGPPSQEKIDPPLTEPPDSRP